MRLLCVFLALSAIVSGCRCGPSVTKISPALNIAPTGISFDKVKVGESAASSVRFESKTNTPVTISSITVEPGTAPGGVEGFKLGAIPTQVDALGNTTMAVTFTPSQVVAYSVTLVITSNDSEKPVVRIPVIGEGAQPLLQVTPECSLARQCNGTAVVSPPSLAFPAEPLTRASPIEVTKLPSVNVVNGGPVNLNVTVRAISGTDATAFTIAGNSMMPNSMVELEPGAGFNLPIRFVPTSGTQMAYSADLKLESDDPDHAVVTVHLTGTLAPNVLPVVCANLIRVTPPPEAGDAPRDYSQRTEWNQLLVPPSGGYDFNRTRDVRPGDLVQFSAISDATVPTACTSDAEDGRTGLTYAWSLTAFPTGAMALAISGSSTSQIQLRPVVTGEYAIALKVTDSAGGSVTVPMKFTAVARQDLVAQLQWQGFSDVDLDLHLIRPQPDDGGTPFSGAFGTFSEGTNAKTSSDINGFAVSIQTAQSTAGLKFDWGISGPSDDDPRLNVDDHGQGALTENVSLNFPENDPACATQTCTYKVMVHYFQDQRVTTPAACTVTGATGCHDGDSCTCAAGKTCVADSLPAHDAGVGTGKCYAPPKPVVRLFFKGNPVPAAVIPLDTLTPSDELVIGAPCQMVYLADINWPAKTAIGSLPDGGTPPPTVVVKGADGMGRITNPQMARFGYRQAGGSLRCSPDITVSGVDWYSLEP